MSRNFEYLEKLLKSLYQVGDCEELCRYGEKLFEVPLHKGSWKLFRYIMRECVESYWMWNPALEKASFPKVEVPSYEIFVTFILHEVTHGWCYFLKKDESFNYPTSIDEEQVCWDVSKIICRVIDVEYATDEANESHKFHLACVRGDMDEVDRLLQSMPAHRRQEGE